MRLAPLLVLVAALIAGCAAAPPPAPPDSLLADRLFASPREAVRTDDIFALSDAMRRYLAVDIASQIRAKGPQIGLLEALQKQTQLKLEYDAARTKNAAAMYANNRAAEALAEGRLDDAYAWAAQSVRADPGFGGAYNTLGVIYLRHGDLGEAERTFERVLAGDAKDPRALANLAETYSRQGRSDDAAAMRQRLAALEPYAPYHFFELGMAAARRDDWRSARELFAREVARADANHEFHFWLGVSDWRLGEEAAALRHLTLAMENSLTRDQHNLYAAKLAWLQAHRQH